MSPTISPNYSPEAVPSTRHQEGLAQSCFCVKGVQAARRDRAEPQRGGGCAERCFGGFSLQRAVSKGPSSTGWAMNYTHVGDSPQGRKEPPESGGSNGSQRSHREGKHYAPITKNIEIHRPLGRGLRKATHRWGSAPISSPSIRTAQTKLRNNPQRAKLLDKQLPSRAKPDTF